MGLKKQFARSRRLSVESEFKMSTSSVPYLATINKDGSPPDSRLTDAQCVSEIVNQMINDNEKRSRVDAAVTGMLNGNPPYSASKLRNEGQSYRANFNSRIGESFRDIALSAYWDSISESPTYATIVTRMGEDDEKQEWSEIITEEFQMLQKADTSLLNVFRLSQHEMVVYRCGPIMFDDNYDFKSKARKCRDVLVLDGTKSNVDDWKLACVLVDYTADELYTFIRNPKAAAAIGWNVEMVRKVLMDAVPLNTWPRRRRGNWEWLEQHIRNNDLYFGSNICEAIPIAHVLYKEFPIEGEEYGRISQCTIVENGSYPEFLFRKIGRYEKWQQVIHPFYYDIGDGFHHSVKGLAIKAYSALETYNRLQCHLVDAAFFGSALHFQARDGQSAENLSITPMGPYIWHPPGAEYLPTVQLGTALQGPMEIKQDVLNQLTSNLAQYRQGISMNKPGNPVTARQIDYEAGNQTVIGKSGLSGYFEQLDGFWAERYRRVTNPKLTLANCGGKESLEFIKRCKNRGVPVDAIRKPEYVRATRTVGYGSADARLQALNRILSRISLHDERGRQNILEDITAADVGHALMRRYVTPQAKLGQPTEQHSQAQDKVAVMKEGIQPMITPAQNPVIYAQVYLLAASQAAQSLQKGADIHEVYAFLQIAGPAIAAQLDRFSNDPTRKTQYDGLLKQWKSLAQLNNKLAQQIEQQQQEQQQQQQEQMVAQQKAQSITSGTDPETIIEAAKLISDNRRKDSKLLADNQRKDLKLKADEQRKARTTAQTVAIKDTLTATQIRNQTVKSRT